MTGAKWIWAALFLVTAGALASYWMRGTKPEISAVPEKTAETIGDAPGAPSAPSEAVTGNEPVILPGEVPGMPNAPSGPGDQAARGNVPGTEGSPPLGGQYPNDGYVPPPSYDNPPPVYPDGSSEFDGDVPPPPPQNFEAVPPDEEYAVPPSPDEFE